MTSKDKKFTNSRDYYIYFVYLGSLSLIPLLNQNSYFLNVLIFMIINTILVMGLYLLWGCAGQINLAPAAFYGIGAYSSAVLTTRYVFSPFSAMLVGIAITIVTSLIIGLSTLRLTLFYFAIATLGFGVIIQIIFIQLKTLTGGPLGIGEIPPFSLGNIVIDNDIKYYIFALLCLAICLAIAINIINSRVGRAWIATGNNELAAQSLSINPFIYKVQAFLVCAVYCSIAGSLYAHYISFISPSVFSIEFTILLIVMVIIGGLASIWGALLGVIALTIIAEATRPYGDYDAFIYSLILILVMMYMPGGLYGMSVQILNQVRKRMKHVER
jgi:branched-chain amino acid transport system permease protein